MYCVNCGSEIKAGLNFCSRCGAKISREDAQMQKSLSANLSSALGYIGGFGFIGYIFVVLVLLKNSGHNGLVAVTFIYFAALFGICYFILQHLKTLSGNEKAPTADFQNTFQTGQLDAADTAQLEEPKQQPISSVTDQTTRTLDKIESKF